MIQTEQDDQHLRRSRLPSIFLWQKYATQLRTKTRKRFYSSSQVQLLPRADNPCRIPSLTCVATAGLSRWRRRRRGSSRVWRRPSRCGNRVFLWIEHGTTLALAVAVRKGEAAAQ